MPRSQFIRDALGGSTVPTAAKALDTSSRMVVVARSLDSQLNNTFANAHPSVMSSDTLFSDVRDRVPSSRFSSGTVILTALRNAKRGSRAVDIVSERESENVVPSTCPLALLIPPSAELLLRQGLDAQHHARLDFYLRVAESDAEECGRRLCVDLLRAQQARRAQSIEADQIGLQQTSRFLEEIAVAVRDRRTALYPDGYQAFLFGNEDIYEGNWKNCMMHGKGSLIRSATRDVYEGQWFLGQRCGTGTLHSPDCRTIYSGAWLDNKRHGRGELVEPEGIYVGEFINNHISGYGEYTYYDGRVYKGEWRDGLFEGTGTYLCRSGSRYEGSWRAGYEHGRGTKLFFNGDAYVGDWVKGRRHGQGIYTSPHFHYKGSWAYDNMCGHGTCVFEDGSSYNGQWDRGLFHGKGCFKASTAAGGAIYYGEFVHGKRHGRGKFVKSSGYTTVEYDGEWRDDEKDGIGLLKGSGCGVYDGAWRHGEPSGDGCNQLSSDCTPHAAEKDRSHASRREESLKPTTSEGTAGPSERSRSKLSTISDGCKVKLNLLMN